MRDTDLIQVIDRFLMSSCFYEADGTFAQATQRNGLSHHTIPASYEGRQHVLDPKASARRPADLLITVSMLPSKLLCSTALMICRSTLLCAKAACET